MIFFLSTIFSPSPCFGCDTCRRHLLSIGSEVHTWAGLALACSISFRRNWHGRPCSRCVRPTCPEADEAFHRAAIVFEVRGRVWQGRSSFFFAWIASFHSWQLRNWHGRPCSRCISSTCSQAGKANNLIWNLISDSTCSDSAFHRAAIAFEGLAGCSKAKFRQVSRVCFFAKQTL